MDNTGENGDNGLPQITSNITVNAHGSTIQRATWPGNVPDFRFFQINPHGLLYLINASIQNGETVQGGAIYSNGTVIINSGSFINNRAHCGGVIINGESATLSIAYSSFRLSDAFE